ncbi:STAS domain-containing protein [candidate division KSB1 bacterium]|nr:STAS domain-containing protein [candidate division KSB1 bacterium]
MEGIQIHTSSVGVRGDIAMVRVQGFIDTNTCVELRKYIDRILSHSVFQVVVDMGAVNYVSSAGWGVFVGEIRGIKESGGDLKIVQMMPDVYEVFEMLEFNRILSYYDNMEEAINDFDIALGLDITRSIERRPSKIEPEQVKAAGVPRQNIMPADKSGKIVKSRKGLGKPKVNEAKLPLAEKIRLIIIDDPRQGVFQIRKALNTSRFGYVKANPIKILQILKRYNWETKEKRIRFYRSR